MIQHLIQIPLNELQTEAFRIRKAHFGNELTFSFPSMIAFQHGGLSCQDERFVAISVTGKDCDLRCGHCKGILLESMASAENPETFSQVVDRLRSHGALGILVSGGADKNGEVPLMKFIPAIRAIKERDPQFKIIVHTGLIQEGPARELREARVDQILIDVIGDEDTIRQVYHLNKRVRDYEDTLWMLKEMGHHLAPHLIIGHHFGEIKGEWRALEIITRVGVETLVLVVIKPFPKTEMKQIQIPKPEETSRISAIARILNPAIPIRIGCIRPAHPSKAEMEKGFLRSGVNTIAYPLQGTIDYAEGMGFETRFEEVCCSLIGVSHCASTP
ncbi:MAG: radical SAM protein [Syntrophaceae bacterium]|nr:radical SAM protein [Syntrophaceae bacterium]